MNTILNDLEEAIKIFNLERNEYNLTTIISILLALLKGEGFIYIPVGLDVEMIEKMKKDGTLFSDSIQINSGANFQLRKIVTDDQKNLLPCFTDKKYYHPSPMTALMFSNFKDYLNMALSIEDIYGVVINPFNNPLLLTKELIKDILEEYEKTKVSNYS